MPNFTFDNTIPATNNNPSDDQPGMLINNQSTQSLIGIDHITFNLNNGGQHKAITFNQDASYVPVTPVTPPQLFTNTVSGLAQLFYYSGTSAQSSTQYVSASAGSTFLLGGMILKWGTFSQVSSPQSVSFASAFPNNCYGVLLTAQNFAGPTGPTLLVASSTVAGFSMRSNILGFNVFYVAIGN